MTTIIDAHQVPWEEQSVGVFVMLNIPDAIMTSYTDHIDMILDKNGSIFYRSLSRRYKKISTTDIFIAIACDVALSSSGILYRIGRDGSLSTIKNHYIDGDDVSILPRINWIGRGDMTTVLMVDVEGNSYSLENDIIVLEPIDDASKLVMNGDKIYRVDSDGSIDGFPNDFVTSDSYGNYATQNGLEVALSGEVITDQIVKILTHRELVFVDVNGISMIYNSDDQLLTTTNIPPERFLTNLSSDSYDSGRIGCIILPPFTSDRYDLPLNSNIKRVICDRVALVSWDSDVDIRFNYPSITYASKTSYNNINVSELLNKGVQLLSSLNRSTQILDEKIRDEMLRDMKFLDSAPDFIDSNIMIQAYIDDSFWLPKIPINSIPIIYKADGEGRELVLSLYGDVIDYRYTPARAYDAIELRGYLNGRDIYTVTSFYSISYRYNKLEHERYQPGLQPKDGKIWIQRDEILYQSYDNHVSVYVENGRLYAHDGVYTGIEDSNLTDGFFKVKITSYGVSDPIPSDDRLNFKVDVDKFHSNMFTNYPNPFDITQAVMGHIKINHRSAVTSLFNRVTKPPYDKIKNLSLLDLGAGSGGDFNRWKRYFKRVLAVEPNVENYNRLVERVKNSTHLVTTVNTNAEDVELITKTLKDTTNTISTVNVIALIDSLTFFGKDELPLLAKTITSTLNRNLGMLIFKVMDGEATVKLLESRGVKNSKDS